MFNDPLGQFASIKANSHLVLCLKTRTFVTVFPPILNGLGFIVNCLAGNFYQSAWTT
jgi:hypothetical protein